MATNKLNPVHPGEILLEEFLKPMSISQTRLAIDLGVYGAPETFILDHKGVIRFRFVGPVTSNVWQETLLPVVEHLRGQADD